MPNLPNYLFQAPMMQTDPTPWVDQNGEIHNDIGATGNRINPTTDPRDVIGLYDIVSGRRGATPDNITWLRREMQELMEGVERKRRSLDGLDPQDRAEAQRSINADTSVILRLRDALEKTQTGSSGLTVETVQGPNGPQWFMRAGNNSPIRLDQSPDSLASDARQMDRQKFQTWYQQKGFENSTALESQRQQGSLNLAATQHGYETAQINQRGEIQRGLQQAVTERENALANLKAMEDALKRMTELGQLDQGRVQFYLDSAKVRLEHVDRRLASGLQAATAADRIEFDDWVKQGDWSQDTWNKVSDYIIQANRDDNANARTDYEYQAKQRGDELKLAEAKMVAFKELYLQAMKDTIVAPQEWWDAMQKGMVAVSHGRALPKDWMQGVGRPRSLPLDPLLLDRQIAQTLGTTPENPLPPRATFQAPNLRELPPEPIRPPRPAPTVDQDVLRTIIGQGINPEDVPVLDPVDREIDRLPTSYQDQHPGVPQIGPNGIGFTPLPGGAPPPATVTAPTLPEPEMELMPEFDMDLMEGPESSIGGGNFTAPMTEEGMGLGGMEPMSPTSSFQAPQYLDEELHAASLFLEPVYQLAGEDDRPRIANAMAGVLLGENPRDEVNANWEGTGRRWTLPDDYETQAERRARELMDEWDLGFDNGWDWNG